MQERLPDDIDFIPEKRPMLEPGEPLKVVSPFEPAGDQPQAIKELVDGIRAGEKDQVHQLAQDKCDRCGACYAVCKYDAIEIH